MKLLTAIVAAVATAFVVSACTSPAGTSVDGHDHGAESSQAGQPAASNGADVAFATSMIPHHQQAVDLSALVPSRSTDPAVVKLAATIASEQGPEIETMKAFLTQWNVSADGGAHEGHDPSTEMSPGVQMNGAEMQGMVDDATMNELKSSKGAEFDKLWLQSMIGHHEGAIQMANTEIAGGANADAKTLARQIVTAQTAEIDQMKKMLGG